MMQKVEICGVNTSGLPKLTQKESEELMKRLKEGDEEAREQFVVGNMRLVLSLVKRFWAKRANADDVFQAGCIGLLKAIDNFDLRVGVKFSTYAVPMIMGEIKRYLRDGNSLRVSRSIRDTAYRVLKTRESIEEKDEEATIEKIAETMNVALKEVVYALDAISDPVSLFEPVFNQSGDALMLMDQIYDEKNNDEVWTEHAALSEAMTRLGERERKILFLRYYEGKTQTEISDEVGISQAQVSRLEKNAINAIRGNIVCDCSMKIIEKTGFARLFSIRESARNCARRERWERARRNPRRARPFPTGAKPPSERCGRSRRNFVRRS